MAEWVAEKVADNLRVVEPIEACKQVERAVGTLGVVRLVMACRLA